MNLSWISPEGQMSCAGECVDASTYGLSAEVDEYITVGTAVKIQFDGFDGIIEAKVRHCEYFRFWYRIGFELFAPLPAAVQERLMAAR